MRSRAFRAELPALLTLLSALAAPAAASAADCPAGMVRIEGGTLDAPGRPRARIPAFCLDRTEVTVDAWAACVAAGACKADELECGNAATWGRRGMGNHPINCVTWAEADAYCREVGKWLPSEAEWEWAARGGERARRFPWGAEPPANRACWDGAGNEIGLDQRKETCAVGAHPRAASADGVADLAGNVREWTSSTEGRHRVVRGGSWGDSSPEFLAAAFRGWNAPDERLELTGFRCAIEPGATARAPRKREPPKKKAAETDEAGVMIFSAPFELNAKPAGKK
jgi:sulfatase modifying factor 1